MIFLRILSGDITWICGIQYCTIGMISQPFSKVSLDHIELFGKFCHGKGFLYR